MTFRNGLLGVVLLVALAVSLVLGSRRADAVANESERDASLALTISDNGRYFVQNGKPFFWLGDAVWSLFTLYTNKEAEHYLEHRRQQGFNVFQTMIVFDGGPGLKTRYANTEGHEPFFNMNPTTPNDAFFQNVDRVIDFARRKGLTLLIMPCGGSGGAFVKQKEVITKENVRAYAEWLGRRYKDVPNIIWVNGFDLRVWEYPEIVQEFAAGIREGDGGSHLMTYHPGGGPSSSYFHQEKWLFFNTIQTWSDYWRAHPMVVADYCRLPVKPVVMAEGAYEEGPEYPTRPITPLVVRKEAYWSYLGGGFHCYGHNDMWRHNPTWRQSLDSPGARQMGILKQILTSRQWWKLVPDQSVFLLGVGSDKTLNVAARSNDGDCIIAYLSSQTSVTIDMRWITASRTARATWVNPQTGEATEIGEFSTEKPRLFTTPQSSEDAVLLLDAVVATKR